MEHYSDLYDAYNREEGERLRKKIDSSLIELEGELRELRSLPKGDSNPKARDIAIAITHIETAILWLKK